MKYLWIMLVLAMPALAVDIVYDDGTVYHVKSNEEVRVVPKGTPDVLLAVEAVKLKDPQPKTYTCTPEGELSLGAPQCS